MAFLTLHDVYRAALSSVSFPPHPHVLDHILEVAPDSTGEDAVNVLVILRNETPTEFLHHATLEPIAVQARAAIRAALQGTQFTFLESPNVYVYFRLKSEHDAVLRGGGR